MAYVARTFAALTDPTRLQVLERLRDGPKPVGEIASGLRVSRPAVSQHLKVLAENGLVIETWIGARHYFAIDPNGLGRVRAEIDQLWSDALASFKRHVEASDREPEHSGEKNR